LRIFGLGPSAFALLALAMPLFSFVTIVTLTLDSRRASAWLSTWSSLLAAGFGAVLLWTQLLHPAHIEHEWTFVNYAVTAGTSAFNFELKVGTLVDPLSAVMVAVVATASFLIQWYAVAFMRAIPGYVRFFISLSLSTFAMLGLTLSTNYFQLLFFWGLLGVCAYLLIGHVWPEAAAAGAARKVFLVTLLADLALVLAICHLYYRFGTLNFQQLAPQYGAGKMGATGLTLLALLVLAAAGIRAGQVPLHIWLPDSVRGPVPAAALLHAATVAVAGAYLVARTYALFQTSKTALLALALVGAASALLGAIWALGQDDLKRSLAYSTMAHLGLVLLGLGVGAYSAALYQLIMHTWFTAGLLLAAGVVTVIMQSDSLREMGGLWRRMPVTGVVVLVAGAAAAGLPPLGPFWSQTRILHDTITGGNVLLIALALAAILAGAVYPVRLFLLMFAGQMARRRAFEPKRVREVPGNLTTPMVIVVVLGILTTFLAAPGTPRPFSRFLFWGKRPGPDTIDWPVAGGVLLLTLAGTALAVFLWTRRARIPGAFARAVQQGFYVDTGYRFALEHTLLPLGRALNWVDRRVLDAFWEAVAAAVMAAGDGLERFPRMGGGR
jgi:NADH-quinone oxidoreductase subunit L